jgi:hypothetical protein
MGWDPILVIGVCVGVWVKYPWYRGLPVTSQNYEYDWFYSAANSWGTIHPVPDMAPPLLAEEEGPPI